MYHITRIHLQTQIICNPRKGKHNTLGHEKNTNFASNTKRRIVVTGAIQSGIRRKFHGETIIGKRSF